jgi:Kef-type K+ transport system membrane component KefB
MGLFLVIASAIGFWLLPKLTTIVAKLPISQGLIALAFTIMLFYAWSAEALGHMATVIGAFMSGMFLARSKQKEEIRKGFIPIAYGIFVPIFFSNVGLAADLRQISVDGLVLLFGTVIVVVVSKLGGAVFGCKLGNLCSRETLQLGFGMIPRGEVVLIVATVGITEGLIGNEFFSTAVMLVVLTTLATPPILRNLFSGTDPDLAYQN